MKKLFGNSIFTFSGRKSNNLELLQHIETALREKKVNEIEEILEKHFPITLQDNEQNQAAELYILGAQKYILTYLNDIFQFACTGSKGLNSYDREVIKKLLRLIIRSKLDLNLKVDGQPLIHRVIECQDGTYIGDAVDILIEEGVDLNCQNSEGLSPLGAYLRKSGPGPHVVHKVQLFLEHGAKLNSNDLIDPNVILVIAQNRLDNVLATIIHD